MAASRASIVAVRRRPLRIAGVLLMLLPAACALDRIVLPAPELDDPALQAFANEVMCRLTPECAGIPVLVLDSPRPQAELLPDGRVAVRLGLARELYDEAELAFVLAHELAHRDLQHRPPRDVAARLPLELEADAWAQEVIVAAGYREDAGTTLLLRMLPPLKTDSDRETVERLYEARRQMRARLDALPAPRAAQQEPPSALAALLRRYRKDAEAERR